MTHRQSDPPIVLGDGRADHEGKGRAGRLNEHSHHALGRIVPNKSVSRTLLELREKAEREPKHRFRSLYREINLPMLYESFRNRKLRPTMALLQCKLPYRLPRTQSARPTEKLQLDRLQVPRSGMENARHTCPKNRGKALSQTSPMDSLLQLNNASPYPLRDRSEEPGAGRSAAEMDIRRKPRRGERSESKPHAGICEGARRQRRVLP